VTETSVVLVTTTIEARRAIAESGAAAALTRSVRLATNPRVAVGLRMSKVSATPGGRRRRARMVVRVRSSAAVVRRASRARAKTCSVSGAPNARS
jgi:hypothetical protein